MTSTYLDAISVETTDGTDYLVQLHEDTRELVFLNDDDHEVCRFALDTIADARAALALDAGNDKILSAEWVAGLQQWARID